MSVCAFADLFGGNGQGAQKTRSYDLEIESEVAWYESKEAIRWAIECSGKCVRGSLVHRCGVWDEAC